MSSGGSPPSNVRRVELHMTHLAAYDSYEYDYAYYSDDRRTEAYSRTTSANRTESTYDDCSTSYDDNEVVQAAVNINITSNGEVLIQEADGDRNMGPRSWELPQTIDYPSDEGTTIDHNHNHYNPCRTFYCCQEPPLSDCYHHRYSPACSTCQCSCLVHPHYPKRLSSSSRVRITSESYHPCRNHCRWSSQPGTQAELAHSFRIFGSNNDCCSNRGCKRNYTMPTTHECKDTTTPKTNANDNNRDGFRLPRPQPVMHHKVIEHSHSTQVPPPSAIYSPMTSYDQNQDMVEFINSTPPPPIHHEYLNNLPQPAQSSTVTEYLNGPQQQSTVTKDDHYNLTKKQIVVDSSLSNEELAYDTTIPIKLPTADMNAAIDMMVPVTLENTVELKLRFPKIKAKYVKKEIEVYLPRIIEVPVPAFDSTELRPLEMPLTNREQIISSIRNISPQNISGEPHPMMSFVDPSSVSQYERWKLARDEYLKDTTDPLTLTSYNELALAAQEYELIWARDSNIVGCR